MRVPDATDACWLDGRRLEVAQALVPVDDPVVQAGLGLFETVAVRQGALLEIDEHLDRLFDGIGRLRIDPPHRDALRATCHEALDGAAACGWLKIILTGGGRTIVFRGAMDPAEEGRESSAVLLPWRRNAAGPLAGMKTLNYAGNRLGLEHALDRGADEGLWLNSRGRLAEGCTSNVFVVHGGKLFTPAIRDGILPGIVRGLALAAARRLGIPVHEGKLRLPRLAAASEAFLTSSLRAVRPLVRFQGRPVGKGRSGPLTRRILAEVATLRRATRAVPPTRPVKRTSLIT